MVKSKRMPSVMTHRFSDVPRTNIQRSSFNRSSGLKTTFNAGYLIPLFCDEVLPGDTFSMQENFLARMSTPIFPLMDNLSMDTQYFFVPLRLLWDNWQRFCGEQKNPGDTTDFLTPIMQAPATTGYLNGSLSDYFGLPTQIPGYTHVSFFHRAYNLIWNEYYRDENLQDSVNVDLDDGPDNPDDYVLLKRGKRHDYFTSCLPWPQKGPSVDLPIAGRAPVMGIGPKVTGTDTWNPSTSAGAIFQADGSIAPYVSANGTTFGNVAGSPLFCLADPADAMPITAQTYNKPPQIYADLGQAGASTINQLRQAFQIQRLYERDARGGTRYIEILRSHFGVTSPDSRLQRPEYLGGSTTSVNISPIPQTSSTDSTSPQGNMAAYGTVSNSRHVFTKSFVEHGVLIGLVSVRADLNYQQGLDRMWSRRTRWDYYWPALAHIGEQAVLNKEIYCQGNEVDEMVFGYQERFAEYRYKTSKITGQFRSNFAESLDAWHLAQEFSNLPQLNEEFIQENPPMSRVLALADYPHFLLDGWFRLRCARPMPVYSVPGLIDHF